MPIINGQGRVAVRVTGSPSGGGSSSSYLLDTYGGAAAAYSLRKLSSTYSGNAIRVRRSSDNIETNIGFDGSGNLDTTALTTFVGAGNGFVVTWFDQSGNGKNATQSTAANQPRIVLNGVVETISSKPAVNMLTLPPMFVSSTTYKNVISVAKADTLNVINYILGDSGNGLFYHGYYGGVTGIGGFDGSNIRSLTGGDTNRHLVWFQMKSSNLYVSKDGSSESNLGSFATSLNLTELGGRSVSSVIYFQGKIQEVILYNNDNTSNKTAIESNINTYYSVYSPMDSDAQAFITAASITDSTQQSAVNTLVTSLKSSGLWNKMKAIYPFVGGTATSHSYNLINTAQYRITWSGGLTHSSTGVLPNGTNGWGYWNTVLTSSLGLLPNNLHISSYVRTNDVSTNAFEIQIRDNGYNNHVLQAKNPNNNSAMYSHTGIPGYGITSANPDSRGFYIGGATSSSSTKFYKNGTLIGSSSGAQSTFNGMYMDLALFGSFSGGATREQAFASLGTGLTDAEASAFYTAVQAFQTTLGRQV